MIEQIGQMGCGPLSVNADRPKDRGGWTTKEGRYRDFYVQYLTNATPDMVEVFARGNDDSIRKRPETIEEK